MDPLVAINWDLILYTGLGVWLMGTPLTINLSLASQGTLTDRLGRFVVISAILFAFGGVMGLLFFGR